MNRTKPVVFIATILLSGIAAVFTYAAHYPPSPGSAMVIVANPPYSSKTWQFSATNSVTVYFENISNFVATLSVGCANTDPDPEYYTILPKEMTRSKSYHSYIPAYNITVNWAFTLSLSGTAQIVGHASWN